MPLVTWSRPRPMLTELWPSWTRWASSLMVSTGTSQISEAFSGVHSDTRSSSRSYAVLTSMPSMANVPRITGLATSPSAPRDPSSARTTHLSSGAPTVALPISLRRRYLPSVSLTRHGATVSDFRKSSLARPSLTKTLAMAKARAPSVPGWMGTNRSAFEAAMVNVGSMTIILAPCSTFARRK